MKKPSSTPAPPLASLDILRGFDLFLLVFFQPVLWTLASAQPPMAEQYSFPSSIMKYLGRVPFLGSGNASFLFMTGASMPFCSPSLKTIGQKDPFTAKSSNASSFCSSSE